MFQFNDCEVYIHYFHVPKRVYEELFDNFQEVNRNDDDEELEDE